MERLIKLLKDRFLKNMHRHEGANWDVIEQKIAKNQSKLYSLNEMEITGGEPDVIKFSTKDCFEYVFCDCSKESPKGRRSLCYDQESLNARKNNKPANNAINMAQLMGVGMLTQEQYLQLQKLEQFDTKTSSWIQTPLCVRQLGGALFAEYRYGQVFIFHNGASSYYSSRGFRSMLAI